MHWKILAGVRFILAGIVFSSHLEWFLSNRDPLIGWTKDVAKFSGISAVLGFLLISGYSIANSITHNPLGFYKRRVFRIYPLYAAAIICSLVPFIFIGKTVQLHNASPITFIRPGLGEILGNLLFLQGFICERLTSNPVVWTLNIEVVCYILAPLFVKFNNKVILVLISLSSLLYIAHPHLNLPYYSFLNYGLGFCMLLWPWLLGFFYFCNQGQNISKYILIIGGLIVVVLNHKYFENIRLGICTYTITSIILVFSQNIKLPKNLLNLLNYLGNLSYPLYLFHVPGLLLGYSVIGISNSLLLVCFSLLFCALSYHTIEVPLKPKKAFNLKSKIQN